MNKTVNCNLAGIVFHMDEDAYAKLHQYLLTIRKYFQGSEGMEEIITDIEARFAELFQEKLNSDKQVVSMKDVDAAIEILGEPEAYLDDEDPIEPAKVRSTGGTRRIYRDGDNSYIGGVCGGLAAYFGTDPIVFRLLFLLLFFGFGSGVIVYGILWILIPEARTAAEKLAMRGEPITASNIGKVVSEEFQDVKSKVGKHADRFSKSTRNPKLKNGLEEVLEGIFTVIGFILKLFLKLFGFAMIILGIVVVVALLSGFFGFGFILFPYIDHHPLYNLDIATVNQMFFAAAYQLKWILIGLCLFGLVPVIHLLYLGIRLLFKLDPMPKVVSLSLLSVWVISLIILGANIVSIGLDFRSQGSYTNEITLDSLDYDMLILDIKDDQFGRYDYEIAFDENNNLRSEHVYLDVKRSYTDDVILRVRSEANGVDKRTAYRLAQEVEYDFAVKDSLILFDDFLTVNNKDKWRGQNVELDLLIPVGTEIFLSPSLVDMIDDIKNVHDMWDPHMVNHRWRMESTGLICVDCDPDDL